MLWGLWRIRVGCLFRARSGDDGNEGSQEKPLKTLGAAMMKGKPVYACAEEFSESVIVNASVVLYGGLDCADRWTYVGTTKMSELTADADAVPLTLASG